MGVAVKLAVDPWQIGFASAVIDTDTGKLLLTVIVIGLELAFTPGLQEELDVMVQVTISPFWGMYE
jgi:hypothetical protein